MFRDASRLERSKWKDSEKWTMISNNALKMFSAGMLGAGAVSFILFRSTVARAATMAFGAGYGVGNAYVDAKFILGHDIPGLQYRTAEVVPKVTAGSGSSLHA